MSPGEPPLLLHSLLTFRQLIFGCLGAVQAGRIVEIGSESGQLTLELTDWAAEHDATVVSVDPDPADRVRARAAQEPRLEVVAGASPGALAGVEPGDVHLIDGDHNHWTVLRELRHAYAGSDGSAPLCILHDLGWPSGRRDMYYAPDRLPPEAVHPHSFERGAVPGRSELVAAGGFRGGGQFAWACHEGGERNGVRTAVEDAVEEIGGLRLATIPAVFGVGLVWPEAAPWGEAVAELAGAYADSPLLEAMEENRLMLYLRLLALQDGAAADRARADRVIAGLNDQVGRLEAGNARLRLEAAGGD